MGRMGELLVILAIVFLLFGTRRLRDFGTDLGAAIKGFRNNVTPDTERVSAIPADNDATPAATEKAQPVKTS